ncbi:MAG: hypothetical protein ILP16_03930 [Spirochaetales bacterium]|nr:hypothetical protein [Spirochaetales bacterium]
MRHALKSTGTIIMILAAMLALASCAVRKAPETVEQAPAVQEKPVETAEQPAAEPEEDDDEFSEMSPVKWAGIRVSSYGMRRSFGEGNFPSVSDMAGYTGKMESLYEGSTGAVILIVGTVSEKDWTCRLAFPLSRRIDQTKSSEEDFYEDYLSAFDKAGYSVWLQVEPGNADLVELAREVMGRYRHHSSVKGFGIDVEWYRPEGTNGYGTVLSNEETERVLSTVREVDPDYTVFVKHWDNRWLPDLEDGIIYVNDSQQFRSLDEMKDEFSSWAFLFEPSPVMFQIGYDADRRVWGKMENPAQELGKALQSECVYGNDIGIIWVDFTLKEVIDR